jgi:hypothetical protein
MGSSSLAVCRLNPNKGTEVSLSVSRFLRASLGTGVLLSLWNVPTSGSLVARPGSA